MTDLIDVLMVNDQRMMTAALARVVAADAGVRRVDSVDSLPRALELVASRRPRVVLLDVRVGDVDDTTPAIPKMLAASPDTRVVVLTAWSDEWSVARAVDAGCHGYLLVHQTLEELLDAVRSVSSGGVCFAPSVLSRVVRRARPSSPRTDGLTSRGNEVLRRLAAGQSTGQIATEMYVSINTVRNHVNNVIRKLHVHSRLEAVTVAVRSGLIRLP